MFSSFHAYQGAHIFKGCPTDKSFIYWYDVTSRIQEKWIHAFSLSKTDFTNLRCTTLPSESHERAGFFLFSFSFFYEINLYNRYIAYVSTCKPCGSSWTFIKDLQLWNLISFYYFCLDDLLLCLYYFMIYIQSILFLMQMLGILHGFAINAWTSSLGKIFFFLFFSEFWIERLLFTNLSFYLLCILTFFL